jgi:hypothetical protein
MKIYILLLSLSVSATKIKNINVPACRNCIFYKPDVYGDEFGSPYSRCEKFGEKNIITNEIKYDFAEDCRKDETKCGIQGRYFDETNSELKMLYYRWKKNLPYVFIIMLIIGLNK